MRYEILKIFLIGFVAISFNSCDIINPSEKVPAYVEVDTVVVNGPNQSKMHDIQDIWLYVDGNSIGTYQVPFTVPVLPTGNQTITLEAGIKESGQSQFRVIYPFLTSYKVTDSLDKKDTVTINPVFQYEDYAKIPLNEDFEDLGTSFEITESSDTTFMVKEDSNTINGKSGYIALDESHTKFDCRTSQLYELSKTSKVYLEFEYFSPKASLTAGVFAKEYSGNGFIDVRYSVINLFPENKWNKIYINLTEVIASKPKAQGFRIYFSASKPEDTHGELVDIYIDNVKLLQY